MGNYITRRLFQMVLVLILLSFVCYGLMSLMPGDPLDIMISSNPKITSEDIVRLKAVYGLDQPMYMRYWAWLTDILSGDFGYSRTYKVPTTTILVPRLFNTFVLTMTALILSLMISIPIGIISALKKGSKFDYFTNLLAFAGISIPSFFLAIILIIIFAVWLEWFPAGGTESVGEASLTGMAYAKDRIHYLVLPVVSLMVLQIGTFVRYTRSAMMEVLGQDYIRTARAKGIKQNKIVYLHALKNALIPLITVISISFSFIFSGAIITETIFAYQGVGRLVYDSIMGNDYNVAMIAFIISIAMVLIMNLVADILYAVVDPRISYK
ncbi:MAG: ABC transporter permease [Bacteriovoracaceae bacterium]|nr:ABC transporter permease [Bacteriovoracaceae bacterium]